MINSFVISILEHNNLGLPRYSINAEEIHVFPENTLISWMGLWSVIFAVLAIVLALICSSIIDKRHKLFEDIANRNLTFLFCFVWFYGFVVYNVGMYTGEPLSLIGNVPMAIVHAFGIFIFDSDVSAIHEPFHNNWWFMAAFSWVHFLAALVSLVFVLKHFGYNMIAALRRRFIGSSKLDTYIFWGMNDATYYLAKDIIKCRFSDSNNFRVVVVRANTDTEIDNVPNGMNRLFNFLSLKSKELDRLKELDCITTNTYFSPSSFEVDENEQAPLNILEKKLHLKSICRIIRKTTSTLHLFFLSGDDNANIQAVANLKKDSVIQAFATRGKIKFYCHARYNTTHRVIEDELVGKNIEVKVVDSSHICVELMKGNIDFHPVKYVDIEKDATVSSAFNALVIGFGEVGMDAVRFLYEFGAFVKSKEIKIERSDFHCHVVDKKMKELAGVFTVNAPSILTSNNWENEESNKMINLYEMDCQGVDFYKKFEEWIDNLNYIVVATGDDEINISLAVRLFRLAIRYRQDDLSKFRIFVRIQHDDNGHIDKIAKHYNRLWTAELKDIVDNKKKKKDLHQKSILFNAKEEKPITLFGSAKSIYKYNNIIDNSQIEKAKKFKKKYDLSINKLRVVSGKKPYPIEEWEDEQNNAMQLVGEYDGYSPTLGGVMRLRRVQSQNLGNCMHEATKKELAKVALGEEGYRSMLKHGLNRDEGSLKYSWRDNSNESIESVQRVLDVLAQTEHLRWNASHAILGYQGHEFEEYKDEARLVHGCLKRWEQLTDITKSYDYNIVDVSLGIIDIDTSNISE